MKISFLYETLRRLLLLGVGITVLGFVLAPEEEPTQMVNIDAMQTPPAAMDMDMDVDRVQQRSLI